MTPEATTVLAVLRAEALLVRSKTISRATGIPWRQVIDAVRELNLAGHLVDAAPGGGYYLIRDEEGARRLRKRHMQRHAATAKMIRAIDAHYPALAQDRLLEV